MKRSPLGSGSWSLWECGARLVLCVALAAINLALVPAPAQAATPPQVTAIPYRVHDLTIPHPTYSPNLPGEPAVPATIFKAVARGVAEGARVYYRWDFDGNGTWDQALSDNGTSRPFSIGAGSWYQSDENLEGMYRLPRLAAGAGPKIYIATVECASAVSASGVSEGSAFATYRVAVLPAAYDKAGLAIRKEKAIDDGIWYLYKTQTKSTVGGVEYASWGADSYRTAFAVRALESAGFGPDASALARSSNPYAVTVKSALNWLGANLAMVGVGGLPVNADGNANGVGLRALTGGASQMDATALTLAAFSGTGSWDATAAAGPVAGRTYRSIAQDLIDMLAYAQYAYTSGSGRGSWYGDLWESKWPIFGLAVAQWQGVPSGAGLVIPAWLKTDLATWLGLAQVNGTVGVGDDGGFSVMTGNNNPPYAANVANTGVGLIGLGLAGVSPIDSRVTRARDYVTRQWAATGWDGNVGTFEAMFAVAQSSNYVTTYGMHDWDADYARWLVDNQRSAGQLTDLGTSGSWANSGLYPVGFPDLSGVHTQAALMTLMSAPYDPAPVAIVDASPITVLEGTAAGGEAGWVSFNHASSYTSNPWGTIFKYQYLYNYNWSDTGAAFDAVNWAVIADGQASLDGMAAQTTQRDTVMRHQYMTVGNYVVGLRVVDNGNPAKTTIVRIPITVVPEQNYAPISRPGGPYITNIGGTLQLDGSGSSDPNAGDMLTYEWELNGDATVDARGPSPVVPWATLQALLRTPEQYPASPASGLPKITVSLRVTDPHGASSTAVTTLTVYNPYPVAMSTSRSVFVPPSRIATVPLDGSASSCGDPRRTITSWSWRRVGGPVIATGRLATATVDVSAATAWPYESQFELTVTDDSGLTNTRQFPVTFQLDSEPPVVECLAQARYVDTAHLSVTASDGSGIGVNSISWSIDGGATETQAGASATILVPGSGHHQVFMWATDEFGNECGPLLREFDTWGPNFSPIANPGGPYALAIPLTDLHLDASGSYDPNAPYDAIVAYAWDLDNDGVYDDATGATPVITPAQLESLMHPAVGHMYRIGLRVTDSGGLANVAETQLTILDRVPPVCDPGGPYSAYSGQSLTLDGSGSSHPYGHALSYEWYLFDNAGSPGVLVASAESPTLTWGEIAAVWTSPSPGDWTRFKLVVRDATDPAMSSASLVTVTLLNSPPVADDVSVTTAEDTALEITLPTTDPDAGPLALAITSHPTKGYLSVISAGKVTYTPFANENGLDSFAYSADDGNGGTDSGVISVDVTPVNDAPYGGPIAVIGAEDTELPINLTATDVDGDDLTYTVVSQPSHGTLGTVAGGTVIYTPAPGFNSFDGTPEPVYDTFTFTADDGHASTAPLTVRINVTGMNDAPVANDDTFTTAEDTPLVFSAASLTANDTDLHDTVPQDLVWVSSVTPGAGTHGSVQWYGSFGVFEPAADFNGEATFDYTVGDSNWQEPLVSDTGTVRVTVTPVNDPPVAGTNTFATNEGAALEIPVSELLANDTDADADTLSFVNGGWVVDGDTHGTITAEYAPYVPGDSLTTARLIYTPEPYYNGPASFRYFVRDAAGAVVAGTVDIGVAPVTLAPTLSACSDPINLAGVHAARAMGTAEPGALVSLWLTDAAGHATDLVLVTGAADGSYSGLLDAGVLDDGAVTYHAVYTDAFGNMSPQTMMAAEKDAVAPEPPEFTSTPDVTLLNVAAVPVAGTAEPGSTVRLRITDAGASQPPFETSVAADPITGAWAVSVNLLGANVLDGSITYSARVADAAGNRSAWRAVGAEKDTNNPPALSVADSVVTVDEGTAASNTGTSGDLDGGLPALSASKGTVVSLGGGAWRWEFSALDRSDSGPVVITATDGHDSVLVTFDLVVRELAPIVGIDPVVDASEGTPVALSGTFTDSMGDLAFGGTVQWGDGTSGALVIDPTTRTYVASHAWPCNGDYTVMVSITDDDGATGTATRMVSVRNLAPAITAAPTAGSVDQGVTYRGTLTFADPGADSWTIGVDWGDGSHTDYPAVAGTPVDLSHIYTTAGSYNVSISVSDGDGGSVSATYAGLVSVRDTTPPNRPPAVSAVTGPLNPLPLGTSANVSMGFTDADPGDTHVGTIVWDDGTTSAASINEAAGTASGTHTYAEPGVYSVRIVLADKVGAEVTGTSAYVVVYDPSAGFVTGGGWLTSPAGAYPADPTLAGKANFGFSSKYKKGAALPSGNTEFQFHAASFNFKSTLYEWLVVSGTKAQFKGEGTVNGTGSYKFMLTCTDGLPDRMRLRVWDAATGTVIYDNQFGADDKTNPVTAIGGGSIIVHK